MMPGGPDGLATLAQLKRTAPDVPVVMMSGKANLADAVRATKLGAFQFLEKPLTPEGVLTTLRAALELSRTLAENRRLHEALGHADPLVGVSPAMERLRALITRVAPTEARVLITGESGTGKELVASAIHRQSARPAQRFVGVNSAAIPKDLVESEMFGHEGGAFTGATERRVGRFELADGGTLFLDEVGDLSLEAQAKLLRVLETGVIERLGGERPLTVEVRVIAATNKDLGKAAQQGQFREDLLFRLNVLPVHIPPLRERPEDVAPLVQHFAARQAGRLGRPVRFDTGAVQLLAAYGWPGNVRELANLVERLAILATGPAISAGDGARAGRAPGGAARPGGRPSPRHDDRHQPRGRECRAAAGGAAAAGRRRSDPVLQRRHYHPAGGPLASAGGQRVARRRGGAERGRSGRRPHSGQPACDQWGRHGRFWRRDLRRADRDRRHGDPGARRSHRRRGALVPRAAGLPHPGRRNRPRAGEPAPLAPQPRRRKVVGHGRLALRPHPRHRRDLQSGGGAAGGVRPGVRLEAPAERAVPARPPWGISHLRRLCPPPQRPR